MNQDLYNKVVQAEIWISYHFNDRTFLEDALCVAGATARYGGPRDTSKGNQNLAVLGDLVMAAVMADAWFETNTPKGHWQNRRSTVLSNANLARVAFDSNLASCLYKNPLNPVPTSDKLAATMVEAVCGAVYKDGGLVALAEVMRVLGITLVPLSPTPTLALL